MKLKLEGASAIAEIVSSIAIVVTLGYLAIQTQQTNQALRAESRQATMLADVQLLSLSFENPDVFLGLFPKEPSVIDFQRGEYFLAFMRVREFAWFQYQNEILDDSAWEAYLQPMLWMIQLEAFSKWWIQFQVDFDSSFVEYVNGRARSTTLRPPTYD